MSTLTNEQQYQQVLADLMELQQEDGYVATQRVPESAKDKNTFFAQFFLSIYAKYLHLARRLCTIYDMQVQPQKLGDIRVLLDSCLGRMLEAKAALVDHCGDFLLLDNVMLDLKLSPEDLEAPVPSYILHDRKADVEQMRSKVTSLQEHYIESEPDSLVAQASRQTKWSTDPTKVNIMIGAEGGEDAAAAAAAAAGGNATDNAADDGPPMSLSEAVRLLQICERGRQARQRAKFQLAIFRQQQYSNTQGKEFQTLSGKDRAASVVQKVVKGFMERKRAAERYEAEKKFLGMLPSDALVNSQEKKAVDLRMSDRKARQHANVAELRQKTLEMEANLKSKDGPKSIENMLDEVLMHMAYTRLEQKNGAVEDLPPPEEGGSLKMLGRLDDSGSKGASTDRRKSSSAGGTGAPPAAQGGKSASASAGAGRKGEEEEETIPQSTFWDTIKQGDERYKTIWHEKFMKSYVEGGDLNQGPDENMLREQLLSGPQGIMSELRQCVDQLVAMEVDNLKERLAAEKNSKKKKAGKAKKQKNPKLKDPTKGVDIETSLNTAIIENKLQLPPPRITLANFIGPANTHGSALDEALRSQGPDEETKKKWQKIIKGWNDDVATSLKMSQEAFEKLYEQFIAQTTWLRDPSAQEVRTFMTENGVLPLGSQVIHDLAPHRDAMLLYGFPGTGKTMLAFGMTNEAGANFFNLSPSNMPSATGIPKTIQLVFYVARMKGPSVIYVDNVEKIFPGKGVKAKKDPLAARGKKMKKELTKAMATLTPTDRVLLVGVTSQPWLADAAALTQLFPKMLYVPVPDYATRVVLLRHFLDEKLKGKSTDSLVEPQTLEQVALLTDGYTAGQLRTLMDISLNPRRLQRVSQHPIDATTFVPALAQSQKPSATEVEQMNTFHVTLPFKVRRANPIEDFKESEEDAKKRKATPKKKK